MDHGRGLKGREEEKMGAEKNVKLSTINEKDKKKGGKLLYSFTGGFHSRFKHQFQTLFFL